MDKESSRPPIDETNNPKKRSFLEMWEARKLGDKLVSTKEEDDDDEETEKDTKKGRISRIWNKLFGKIATTEPLVEKTEDEKPAARSSLFEFLNREPEPEEEADLPGLAESEMVTSQTETPLKQQTETTEPGAVTPQRRTEGETKINHDKALPIERSLEAERTLTPPVVEVSPTTISTRPETQEPEPDEIVELDQPIAAEPAEIVTDRLHYEDLITATEKQADQRAHEAAAAQALMDRRILQLRMERETGKVKREVRKNERELEKVIKKTNPTIEIPTSQSERHINRYPETIERTQPLAQKIEQRVERAETTERAPQPISRVEFSHELSPAPTISPESLAIPLVEAPKVERILEKVVDAAEHNEPIEKSYEQRHEVKDTDRPTSPVPIGSVMTDTLKKYDPQHITTAQQQASAETLRRAAAKPLETRTQSSELYAAAIRWGFWSAAAIIILGIVAYVVVRR